MGLGKVKELLTKGKKVSPSHSSLSLQGTVSYIPSNVSCSSVWGSFLLYNRDSLLLFGEWLLGLLAQKQAPQRTHTLPSSPPLPCCPFKEMVQDFTPTTLLGGGSEASWKMQCEEGHHCLEQSLPLL